jgi:hypothetical protein
LPPGRTGHEKKEPGQSSQLLENRPDSFRSKLDADDRRDRTPVGITEHAQSLHLEPVNRGWCQAGDRDRLLNGGCRDCRPRTGRRSVHYRITDEVRLCAGLLFDSDDNLTGIHAKIQRTECRRANRLRSGLTDRLRGKTTRLLHPQEKRRMVG